MFDLKKYYPFVVVGEKGGKQAYFTGTMPCQDLQALSILAEEFKVPNMVIYEIGAWSGMSTCCLGEVAKEMGGKMFTIDTFGGNGESLSDKSNASDVLLWNLFRFELGGVVTILKGKSNDFYSNVDDESIDFLFIDGDHRYSQVIQDIDNWYPKIKVGGVISGHDYNSNRYDEDKVEKDCVNFVHHGVTKAVNERFKDKLRLWIDDEKRLLSSVWHVVKEGK